MVVVHSSHILDKHSATAIRPYWDKVRHTIGGGNDDLEVRAPLASIGSRGVGNRQTIQRALVVHSARRVVTASTWLDRRIPFHVHIEGLA